MHQVAPKTRQFSLPDGADYTEVKCNKDDWWGDTNISKVTIMKITEEIKDNLQLWGGGGGKANMSLPGSSYRWKRKKLGNDAGERGRVAQYGSILR